MPISRRLLLVGLYIIGIADMLLLTWAVNRIAWPANALIISVALAFLFIIYWLWTTVGSKVFCPACGVDGAHRAYDSSGDEFIQCKACGHHEFTGNCRPES